MLFDQCRYCQYVDKYGFACYNTWREFAPLMCPIKDEFISILDIDDREEGKD